MATAQHNASHTMIPSALPDISHHATTTPNKEYTAMERLGDIGSLEVPQCALGDRWPNGNQYTGTPKITLQRCPETGCGEVRCGKDGV